MSNFSSATSRRRFVQWALGATVAAPLAGCSVLNGGSGSSGSSGGNSGGPVEKSNITLGILGTQGSVGAKLAEKYGYFKQQGLNVTIKPYAQGPQAVPALINGELDFAVINYVSYYQAIAAKTLDAKVVVDGDVATETSQAIMAKPDSGIRTAKDLVGKKVGIQASKSLAELLVRATLKDNDVDPNSVTYLPITFPNIPAAIKSGQLDAGVEVEPYLTTSEQKDGLQPVIKIISGSTANMPVTGYIATSKFIDANPKTVAAFQRALFTAQRDATDRAKVAEVLPELSGVDQATAALLNLDTFPTANNPAQLQRVITLLQAYGGMTAQLNAADYLVPTPQM
ncbi:ABC transporter substrate-binding protein [Amycolatopsis sp. K13G38]|uniref:ABC transporter substrate-binding protein n=1 Tax=Amycolatopsis acididurans TaxID=2724524 RepID=A0ABX1J5S0_9PSEU|nr:ABC transporter substrate-binding protein [Amycolatopsis acididurans]NKQ55158.1 ABC transporter substrate-binding protein [Amycolatopsis acididurans]